MEEPPTLPGVGEKSAQCPAFHIINMPTECVASLTDATRSARQNMRYCKEYFTLTSEELRPICKSVKRNHRQIMVIENTRNLTTHEKTEKYEGIYHMLHGAISPMPGIGPSDIKPKELMRHLGSGMEKVIIATNPSLEGETTAMYVTELVKPTGIRVSGIASRVPVGGDLEHIGEVTLLCALEGRAEL